MRAFCRTRSWRRSAQPVMRRMWSSRRPSLGRRCDSLKREPCNEGVAFQRERLSVSATGGRIRVDPAAPLVLAALARLSKKARLLILGNPIANRRQPVRVAEEMAMVDVLSRGRLEAGFVRGVPYEVLPANSNPVRIDRKSTRLNSS